MPGERFPRCAPIWGLPADFGAEKLPRAYNAPTDSNVYDIVPNNSANLDIPISQFYVGSGGDVRLETEAGQTVTLHNLAEGVTYVWTFTIVKIFATGTTATNLVGIY